MKGTIAVVDDEESLRQVIRYSLEQEGFRVHTFATARDALEFSRRSIPDVWLVDLKLPDMSGIDFIRAIREQDPYVPILIITAYASLESALEAIRMHAHDYLPKPFDVEVLVTRIRRALEDYRVFQENLRLRQQIRELQMPEDVIFASPVMKQVMAQVERIAPTLHTVLITGESGVGKEVVARLIHEHSLRKDGPFISVNCAALPSNLLETELFGHVKGAFTGAVTHKKGLFVAADGGTLFLDEIGDMSLEMQAKLLRVLEHHRVRPVGATEEVEVDVRTIAATNQDLAEKVRSGSFREDLYYRLNVFHLQIPPLRERPEDILPLAEAFLVKHARLLNRTVKRLADETREVLQRYSWPGNVRELENAMVRAVLMEPHEELHPHALPPEILDPTPRVRTRTREHPQVELREGFDLDRYIEDLRRRFIETALRRTGGSRKAAAQLLGIPLRSLKYYMQKYRLSARAIRRRTRDPGQEPKSDAS